MPNKIRKWTKRAQEAAKNHGLVNLVAATEYSHNHLSQCQLGKRWTSPFLANALSVALDIPRHEFGQRKVKA